MVKQSLNTLPAGTFAISFYWTADGSGNVPATLASSLPEIAQGMRILQVETAPGSPAPTNGYSVALKNSFGTDIMVGALVSLSSSANQLFGASIASPPFVGLFSLVVTGNSVANAQGTVVVYFGATQLINSNTGSPGPAGPTGATGPAGPSGGGINPVPFQFSPQTPGGTLSSGISATVTLSPVPLGVNGTDSHHYLYVSGGTGTAEPVLITGGTAVSGASSGTIIFTPANNHSGAWQIATATAGAQEAHNANPGSLIAFPAGTFNWYGTFWSNGQTGITGQGATGNGSGGSGTILQFNALSIKMLDIERDGFFLFGVLLLQAGGTATAGNIGLYIAGLSGTVGSATLYGAIIRDVFIQNFYNGISLDGGADVNIWGTHVANSVQDGIVSHKCEGNWHTILTENGGGNGITLTGSPVTFMSGVQTFNNQGWGLHATSSSLYISGISSFFNNDKAGEIYLSNAAFASSGWINDASVQFAGNTISWGVNNVAPGILIDTGTGPITIENIQFFNGQGSGLVLKNPESNVSNCFFLGNGAGGQSGNLYGIDCSSGSESDIEGNFSLDAILIGGSGNTFTGNRITANTAIAAVEIAASSTDQIIDNNFILQAGAGNALKIDSGVTYQDGNNTIFSGTVSDSGNRASASRSNANAPVIRIGSAVSSASSITATSGVFHVTGTAAISNLTSSLPIGPGNAEQIVIIPDGIFTLATGGNIAIASTAVVGKAMVLIFDGTTSLWYPSY